MVGTVIVRAAVLPYSLYLGGLYFEKKLLACLAGAYFVTGIGYAAPVVDVVNGDLFMDVSYNRLDVDDVDLKFNAAEITFTHGLSDKLALSTGVTFTGEEKLHTYGPLEANICDLKLQYKASKEFAPFIGFKKWEIDYEGMPVDMELASATGMQYGFIYNKKLSDKTNAFAMASFGNDIQEYKLGLAYAIQKDWTTEINYKKISLDAHGNDIDAKGLGFGVTYKF